MNEAIHQGAEARNTEERMIWEGAGCVPVYLLAGGKSTRFGSDKARALVRGEPLLLRVLRSLGGFRAYVRVVAREVGAYDDLGVETIADIHADRGPLGGLHCALCDLIAQRLEWLLLMPCDLLGLEEDWLWALWKARQEGDRAVAFLGERWEPLCALYHVSALPMVERQIERRDGALWRLLDLLEARSVECPQGWAEQVIQANTPQALARYAKGSTQGP